MNRQTVDVLEKYRAATALQLSVGHDGNAIAEKVRFFHEVSRQDHGASGSLTLEDVPRLSPCLRVHSGRRLVQNYDLITDMQHKLPSLIITDIAVS